MSDIPKSPKKAEEWWADAILPEHESARSHRPINAVDWKWIELPPSLKEHHAFEVLERELSKVGVKVRP